MGAVEGELRKFPKSGLKSLKTFVAPFLPTQMTFPGPGEGGTQQRFIRGGSVQRSNPLTTLL